MLSCDDFLLGSVHCCLQVTIVGWLSCDNFCRTTQLVSFSLNACFHFCISYSTYHIRANGGSKFFEATCLARHSNRNGFAEARLAWKPENLELFTLPKLWLILVYWYRACLAFLQRPIHVNHSIFSGPRSVPILQSKFGTSSVPFPLPKIIFSSVPVPI